jgi:hypothetical protein
MISKMDILTIIPPKILDRISPILIIFINTNFQHKEGSFDSVIGQSDQKKQIISRWLERCQARQMKEKEKIVKEIIKIQMADAIVLAKAIPAEEDSEDAEEAEEDAAGEETTIVSIFKMLNISIVAKRATIILTAQSQKK